MPRPRLSTGSIIANLVLMSVSAALLIPFVWMAILSLAPQGEIFSGALVPVPSLQAAHDNYGFALSRAPLLRTLLNGVIVCGAILFLQVVIAAPAGYALAKLPFRGRRWMFAAVVIGLMIPIQVPAIPIYVAFAYTNLLDTYAALILPFAISTFAIFLFRQFFLQFPDDVLDAARLDGFSEFAIVWRLALPAAWPAVAAFSIFSIVANWNDLYWPLVVTTRPELMTPTLGIATFRQSGDSAGNVGALMAGGVMVTLPLVLLFAFAQRYFVNGLAMQATLRAPQKGPHMKSIRAARTLSAILVLTCALSRPVSAETELSGYHTYAAHDFWQNELVKRFKILRPDIDITYRTSAPSYEDGLLTISRQSLTGQVPDFHLGGMQLLRAFVARKMIQPFDDLLVGKDMAAMGYSKEILAEGQLDGHQYALPWGVSTPVVFINADLVRKAGGDPDTVARNWDDLIPVAGRISRMGPDMMGMYWETGTDDWMTQNLLLNNAAPLLSPDERSVGFNTDRGLAALELYQRFFREGGQKPIELQAARQTFFAGKMGFYVTTTAAIRSFRTESGNRFALMTASLPLMSPDATLSSAGMVAFILTKDPVKRRAALDFILFGTNAESQAWVVLNTGYMPSNTGALRADLLGDFYRDNPAFYTSVTQLPRARAWLGWPGENAVKISGIVRDYMTSLSNGQAEPQATLTGMAHDINALLPQR